MSVFSDRINKLMSKQHISQKQLAKKANVTESAMSYYVKGERTPRSDVLSRIASALGVTTDYLLGNDLKNVNKDNESRLQYLQRNLGNLNQKQLKKAEILFKTVFDDIFDDDEE